MGEQKQRMSWLSRWLIRGVLLLGLLTLPITHAQAPPTDPIPTMEEVYVTGVVESVKTLQNVHPEGSLHPLGPSEKVQIAEVTLTSGPLQGERILVENILTQNPVYNIQLYKGARVLLNMEQNPEGNYQFYVADFNRLPVLNLLLGGFLLAVLVVGGRLILKHLALFGLTLALLVSWILPALQHGSSGVLLSIGITILVGILAIFGLKVSPPVRSRLLLCTTVSMLLLLLFIGLVIQFAPLHGFSSEQIASLWFQYPKMDVSGLLFLRGGVIFLAAFLYLHLSILQPPEEPKQPHGFQERFQLGLQTGQATLARLLVIKLLMLTGLFLPYLMQLQDLAFLKFMNLEPIATVIALILAGELALILSVPMAAWIFARTHTHPL